MFGIYVDENLPEPKKRGGEPKALQPKSKENVLKALKSIANVRAEDVDSARPKTMRGRRHGGVVSWCERLTPRR